VTLVAWTGMRGVVSLAAALALPLTTQSGAPFPGRNLIMFLTFAVILATLVGQGLTLPLLIRWLGVKDDGLAQKEECEARLQANQAALERLHEVAAESASKPGILQRLRVEYEERIQVLTEVCSRELGRGPHVLFSPDYDQFAREALDVERATILRLRNEHVINDEVHRRIQHDIDLAEARLGQREAA
jgi:CPA1 family monovalent cation:H+ antiporter